MSDYSYNSVNAQSMLKLESWLEQDRWATVPLLTELRLDSPILPSVKYVILRDIKSYHSAQDGTFEGAHPADLVWDNEQSLLDLELQIAARSDDPAKRDAANILRRELLAGNGTAQTNYSFSEQVAFGTNQRSIAHQEPYKTHIASLSLEGRIQAIEAANSALDAALGQGVPSNAKSRKGRLREAERNLRLSLQWAHRTLAQLARSASDKAEREEADALLLPFETLQAG